MADNGPWETLLEGELADTIQKPVSLLNFTFDQPAEVQFLKFDLVSFWGTEGGLQYFPNHKWQQSTGALPLFPSTFYTLIIAALAFL